MTTITIPMKEYKQSIQLQKNILSRLDVLQRVVLENSRDEINPTYMERLAKIERGLSVGKGTKLKNKSEIKKFLRSL